MPRVWWRTRTVSIVTALTAAAAATGCAAGVKGQPSAPPTRQSVAATGVTAPPAAPRAAAAGDPNAVLVPAPAPPLPRCPPLVRYAAGNAGPLFCTDGRDNPAALRYFSTLNLKIMQLTATAPQSQATEAICADLRHASEGTEYSAYLLAATREHWYFTAIAKVHGSLHRLCAPASPPPAPSPSRT